MGQLLGETRIILIHPTLPENVGAVARAMRHFQLRDLVIAAGGVDPLHPLAIRVAAGAEAILQEARQVSTLEEALQDVIFAVGTTARDVAAVDTRPLEPREAALLARDFSQVGAVALLFGTEKHGLPLAYLKRCHQVARIPGTKAACLNLAMAMTIFGYEWFLADGETHDHGTPLLAAAAPAVELDRLGDWFTTAFLKSGIFRSRDAASKAHTLRRILSKARLDADEAALVRAIAAKLSRLLPSPPEIDN